MQQSAAAVQESSEEKKPSTATATVDEEDESTIDVTKVTMPAFEKAQESNGALQGLGTTHSHCLP